jgi:hypothetical protein
MKLKQLAEFLVAKDNSSWIPQHDKIIVLGKHEPEIVTRVTLTQNNAVLLYANSDVQPWFGGADDDLPVEVYSKVSASEVTGIDVLKPYEMNGWFSAKDFPPLVTAMWKEIRENGCHWLGHAGCKYLSLYVDQRTGDFIVKDYDGNKVSRETLLKMFKSLMK